MKNKNALEMRSQIKIQADKEKARMMDEFENKSKKKGKNNRSSQSLK